MKLAKYIVPAGLIIGTALYSRSLDQQSESDILEIREQIMNSVAQNISCPELVEEHNRILDELHERCAENNTDLLYESLVEDDNGDYRATIDIATLENCEIYSIQRLPLNINEQVQAMETALPDVNFAKDILSAGVNSYWSLSLLSRYVVRLSVSEHPNEFTDEQLEIAMRLGLITQ